VTNYPADHVLGAQRNGVNNTMMETDHVDTTTGPVRDTTYPVYPDALLDWYRDQGMASVRQTFTWEAVQSAVNTTLPAYADYWDDLARPTALLGLNPRGVVQRLLKRGIYVTLAMWQGNPKIDGDTDITYQGAAFGATEFANFWAQFVNAINSSTGNDQRVSFDLINEPHEPVRTNEVGIALPEWVSRSKAAITEIRKTGATNTIFWEGMEWSSAQAFVENKSADAFLEVRKSDPLNNIAVSVHNYNGPDHPRNELAVRDACVCVVNWAKNNEAKVHIGEVAVDIGEPTGDKVIGPIQWTNWRQFCLDNKDVIVGWHWWGNSKGGWWDDGDSKKGRHWALTKDDGKSLTSYGKLLAGTFVTT
jgi:hypothetical protein